MQNTTELLAVKTKTGEAIHVAVKGFMGRTLCGRRPAFHLTDLDATITSSGIQHPWRCEKCHNGVVHMSSAS